MLSMCILFVCREATLAIYIYDEMVFEVKGIRV
jgi:hypothetical protein